MNNYNYPSYQSQIQSIMRPHAHMNVSPSPSYRYNYGHQHQYERMSNDPHQRIHSPNHPEPVHIHLEYSHPHVPPAISNRPAMPDPPSWASPARGESSLEPIGETALTHPPVDLTIRKFLRIGRSPSSTLPLLHSTSSRRHAILFHHPNGSCYVTDCHSAHGTYVDGVRVKPHPHPPKRVRRGALIRFGGPGAPTFVLKSFSVRLEEMVKDLGGVAEAYFSKSEPVQQTPPIICESSSSEEEETPSETSNVTNETPVPHCRRLTIPEVPTRRGNGVLACIRGDGGGVACIADGKDAPEAALVLLNTRLNAVGKGALQSEFNREMARTAQAKFENMGLKRKREESDFEPCYHHEITTNYKRPKRGILKKSALYHSKQNPCTPPKAVVVPENMFTPYLGYNERQTKRRVIFSDEKHIESYAPTVTPDGVSSDEDETRDAPVKTCLTMPIL